MHDDLCIAQSYKPAFFRTCWGDCNVTQSCEELGWESVPSCIDAYLLLTTYYLLLTIYYLLLAAYYRLFTTHYSLLTTYYLLLTIDYLLLTTYY